MNIKLNPIIFNMVGFFIYPGIIFTRRHPFDVKAPDPKQMGACNQGKEDFKQLAYSRMHSASSASGGSTGELEKFA